MRYRKLGKTDMEAGVIGLGAEHLDGKAYACVEETLDAARDFGVNMVDVFMPGSDVRQKIGRAIHAHRSKFLLQGHIGSTDINEQYDISRDLATCKKYFEGLLRDLGTDYIDFGMLFMIDTEAHFDEVFYKNGIAAYAQDLKKAGVLRGIGASSHDPVIAKKVVETGIVDLLMFSINPAFDMVPAEVSVLDYLDKDFDKSSMLSIDEKRLALYKTCEKLEVPITVMKTLGGGKLLSAAHTPFEKPLTVHQCIHYALTRPAVASVLIGCQGRREVQEAVAYLDAAPASLDYTEAIRGMSREFSGSCVYCNHCLPCPAGIDIAAVTKYLDIAEMDENAAQMGVGAHYRALDAHGSDCIECGSCEQKCPFSVRAMANMARAAEVFGL